MLASKACHSAIRCSPCSKAVKLSIAGFAEHCICCVHGRTETFVVQARFIYFLSLLWFPQVWQRLQSTGSMVKHVHTDLRKPLDAPC